MLFNGNKNKHKKDINFRYLKKSFHFLFQYENIESVQGHGMTKGFNSSVLIKH